MAGPRILSNATDAPYLGEAAVLYFVTRMPAKGFSVRQRGRLTGHFYVGLLIYFLVGGFWILMSILRVRRWRRRAPEKPVSLERQQFIGWLALILGEVLGVAFGQVSAGVILILLALLLPRGAKSEPPADTVNAR